MNENEFWYEVIQPNWDQGWADAVQFMSLMHLYVTFVPKCALPCGSGMKWVMTVT